MMNIYHSIDIPSTFSIRKLPEKSIKSSLQVFLFLFAPWFILEILIYSEKEQKCDEKMQNKNVLKVREILLRLVNGLKNIYGKILPHSKLKKEKYQHEGASRENFLPSSAFSSSFKFPSKRNLILIALLLPIMSELTYSSRSLRIYVTDEMLT